MKNHRVKIISKKNYFNLKFKQIIIQNKKKKREHLINFLGTKKIFKKKKR
jgi:hypothetical protein